MLSSLIFILSLFSIVTAAIIFKSVLDTSLPVAQTGNFESGRVFPWTKLEDI